MNNEEVAKAAVKLVRKLERIHDDPKYQAVWQMYAVHGMNYTGPTYTEELFKLKELIGDYDYK